MLTDARFSGVSTGACIGHVSPEALAGGPIGKVRDGDLIEIVIDRVNLEGSVNLVGADGSSAPKKARACWPRGRCATTSRPTRPARRHPPLGGAAGRQRRHLGRLRLRRRRHRRQTEMSRSRPGYGYLLSLPERVIRSLSALSGGLLREIGDVVLPAAVRRTTLYRTMVEVALRFLIEEVGAVDGVYPAEGNLSEHFILKRTASHGIELLGILAFQASPVWVLAALADATGSGRKLIAEISDELIKEGLIEERFETVEGMLSGLEKTSDRLAGDAQPAAGRYRGIAPRVGAVEGGRPVDSSEECSADGEA